MTSLQKTVFWAVKPAALAVLVLLAAATWWVTGVLRHYEVASEVDRAARDVDLRLSGFVSDFERSLAYVRSVSGGRGP